MNAEIKRLRALLPAVTLRVTIKDGSVSGFIYNHPHRLTNLPGDDPFSIDMSAAAMGPCVIQVAAALPGEAT